MYTVFRQISNISFNFEHVKRMSVLYNFSYRPDRRHGERASRATLMCPGRVTPACPSPQGS